MNLEEIREETENKKRLYWEWLKDIKSEQAALLLAFVQDAFREDSRRGEHLDQKGNWILAACFTAIGVMAIVSKSAVADIKGLEANFTIGMILAVFASLIVAIFCVLWGIRVTTSWFPPNPDLVFRKEIFEAEMVQLQTDLILHYAQNFALNARVWQDKARSVRSGQWFLLVAVGLATLLGAARLFF